MHNKLMLPQLGIQFTYSVQYELTLFHSSPHIPTIQGVHRLFAFVSCRIIIMLFGGWLGEQQLADVNKWRRPLQCFARGLKYIYLWKLAIHIIYIQLVHCIWEPSYRLFQISMVNSSLVWSSYHLVLRGSASFSYRLVCLYLLSALSEGEPDAIGSSFAINYLHREVIIAQNKWERQVGRRCSLCLTKCHMTSFVTKCL